MPIHPWACSYSSMIKEELQHSFAVPAPSIVYKTEKTMEEEDLL